MCALPRRVGDALFAVMQLAQTTMRSEIGKMSLDQTFKDRITLNASIVRGIEEASTAWGVQPLRFCFVSGYDLRSC